MVKSRFDVVATDETVLYEVVRDAWLVAVDAAVAAFFCLGVAKLLFHGVHQRLQVSDLKGIKMCISGLHLVLKLESVWRTALEKACKLI